MRKLIAGLAGAAMVASMAAPAFASTSTDVKGTSSESAVAQLEALGVVTGDAGTGNFRPSDTITRGEFAVIADRLAGLGAAAQYLGQVDTSFKDVKKGYWGSGWVNVAKNAGLVAGYEDGTFRPDSNVTYAEVATVYLHLLGYNEQHLGGTWPTNDVIKAAALGITANASFDANKPATRGDVANMAQTLLSVSKVTWDNNNSVYNPAGTILNGVLKATQSTVVLTGTANTPAATTGLQTPSGYVQLGGVNTPLSTNVNVVGAASLDSLVGQQVSVVKDSNGNVVFVQAVTTSSNVTQDTYTSLIGNTLTLGSGATATVTSSTQYYLNGIEQAGVPTIPSGANLTIVKDANGNVVSVSASKYTVSDATLYSITPGTTVTQFVYAVGGVNAAPLNADSNTVVTLNGASAKITDLKAGDALYINTTGSHPDRIDAVRNTVTGTLNSFTTGTNPTVTVNNVAYPVSSVVTGNFVPGDNVTLTIGQANKVVSFTDNTTTANVVNNAYVSPATQAVVWKYDPTTMQNTEYNQYNLFNNSTGKTTTIQVLNTPSIATGAYMSNVLATGYYSSINFDGKGNVLTSGTAVGTGAVTGSVTAVNASANTITVAGQVYQLTSSTAVLNTSALASNGSVVNTTKLGDIQVGANVVLYPASNGFYLNAMLVTQNGVNTSNAAATVSGVFQSWSQTSNGTTTTTTVTLDVNGQNKTVTFDPSINYSSNLATVFNHIHNGSLVQLVDGNQDGTYDLVHATSNVITGGVTTDVYSYPTATVATDHFTAGGNDYYVDSNSTVYIVDALGNVKLGTLADLSSLGTNTVTVVAGTSYGTTKFHADAVVIGPNANN